MAESDERQVTVSLPYYQCRPFLRRAVESILSQSHEDLTLVVLNDGDDEEPWDLLADIADERLVRFDLDTNRGRYFADAVTLAATSDAYFAVQDADDWSSLDRLTLLYETIREHHADAAFSAVYEHQIGRREAKLRRYPECTSRPEPGLRMIANHFGLFRSEALRSIGGNFGGFRIGYDRFLIGVLSLTGRLAYVDEGLYHRDLRSSSLSSSPETGMGSKTRWEARAALDLIYEDAYQEHCGYVSCQCDLLSLRRSVAGLSQAGVSPQDGIALRQQAERLRHHLGQRRRARHKPFRAINAWTSLPQPPRGIRRFDVGRVRPDVSVVMPIRYETEALVPTMASFLERRARDTAVQFVVVDDASPTGVDGVWFDGRLDFRGRGASLTVVRPPNHLGITRARNLGARYARGNYLLITDAHVEAGSGWDAILSEHTGARRVLAATTVDRDTGNPGFGASLDIPAMTMHWNADASSNPTAVHIAPSTGMVLDRNLFWSIGGFDEAMMMRGSAEAEFSLRAWLRGAEVLNVPDLIIYHQFRNESERSEAFDHDLHFTLHNRIRFALLYLPEQVVISVLRQMASLYPAPALAHACDLVESSDVWQRRAALREQELFSFTWFIRRFGFDTTDDLVAVHA